MTVHNDPNRGERAWITDALEHDDTTGIGVKRVGQYVWDTNSLTWERWDGLVDIDMATEGLATEATLAKVNVNVEKYGINNIDTATAVLTYTGKEDKDGNWLVLKIDTTTGTVITYATILNNAGVLTYAAAWAARATTLTYGTFSAAF